MCWLDQVRLDLSHKCWSCLQDCKLGKESAGRPVCNFECGEHKQRQFKVRSQLLVVKQSKQASIWDSNIILATRLPRNQLSMLNASPAMSNESWACVTWWSRWPIDGRLVGSFQVTRIWGWEPLWISWPVTCTRMIVAMRRPRCLRSPRIPGTATISCVMSTRWRLVTLTYLGFGSSVTVPVAYLTGSLTTEVIVRYGYWYVQFDIGF